MFKISLKKDKNDTDRNGYQVTVYDTLLEKTEAQFMVHTNAQGNGLWVDSKQVAGTSQFTFVGAHSYRAYFNVSYNGDFEQN